MHLFRDLLPAEDPDPDKYRFEEECYSRFNSEGGSEDIADVTGIFRPVEPELELHRNAGDDSERKVYEEELPPELRHLQPGCHDRQAECQRDKDPVKHAGRRKL